MTKCNLKEKSIGAHGFRRGCRSAWQMGDMKGHTPVCGRGSLRWLLTLDGSGGRELGPEAEADITCKANGSLLLTRPPCQRLCTPSSSSWGPAVQVCTSVGEVLHSSHSEDICTIKPIIIFSLHNQ